jgi:hypothetical protein
MLRYPTEFVPSTVQLLKVPEVGVPKTGVTKVGDVDKTLLPEPVDVVTPVPPLVTAKVPVTSAAAKAAKTEFVPLDRR